MGQANGCGHDNAFEKPVQPGHFPVSGNGTLVNMSNPHYIRIILGGLAVAVSVLSGCRQPQPDVRSLLSYPETWAAARNEDRLLCDAARKGAGETDSAREKLLTQFLASNRVNDVVMLLEYANPACYSEYRMIIVTKRDAYQLSSSASGETAVCRLKITRNERAEIRRGLEVLAGYSNERIWLSHNAPCFVFVTVYERQKATRMFFSEMPHVGLKRERVNGIISKNSHYLAFHRLCEILLLAKVEYGVVLEFKTMQL